MRFDPLQVGIFGHGIRVCGGLWWPTLTRPMEWLANVSLNLSKVYLIEVMTTKFSEFVCLVS